VGSLCVLLVRCGEVNKVIKEALLLAKQVQVVFEARHQHEVVRQQLLGSVQKADVQKRRGEIWVLRREYPNPED
jgi:hypothetical protein